MPLRWMLASIWRARTTEGLYLLTAAWGQHLNLSLATQNFQEPTLGWQLFPYVACNVALTLRANGSLRNGPKSG